MLILPPISSCEVFRVNAQPVVAAVAHHIVPPESHLVFHTINKAVGVDLLPRDTDLGGSLRRGGEAS